MESEKQQPLEQLFQAYSEAISQFKEAQQELADLKSTVNHLECDISNKQEKARKAREALTARMDEWEGIKKK